MSVVPESRMWLTREPAGSPLTYGLPGWRREKLSPLKQGVRKKKAAAKPTSGDLPVGPVRDTRLPGDREVAHRAGEVTAVEGTERQGRRAAGRVGESEREPRVEVLSLVDSGEHERTRVGRRERRVSETHPVRLSKMRQLARSRARVCAETAAYSL